MTSILFVCTGNIFRSMVAEWTLKAHLDAGSELHIHSAGTIAKPQPMNIHVKQYLLERGVDPNAHRQKKLTDQIIEASDLVIAMGRDHQDFLYDNFDYEAPLFMEVCNGLCEPILDIHEVVPEWEQQPEEAYCYAKDVVDVIAESVPEIFKRLPLYINTSYARIIAS